jgi:histidine triad (HIT) family protein
MCDVMNSADPAPLVYSGPEIVAFPPLRSETPVHLLIVPVRHFASLPEMIESSLELVGAAAQVAGRLADALGLVESGIALCGTTAGTQGSESGTPTFTSSAAGR